MKLENELKCQTKLFFFFFFSFFLGRHPRHIEVPRLGVKWKLQLPAYATVTVTPVPSRICDLQHSPRLRQILNPLSEARDQTRILLGTSPVHFCWATMGTPTKLFFFFLIPPFGLVSFHLSLFLDLFKKNVPSLRNAGTGRGGGSG